jgi:hypothetical protein
LVVLVAVVVQDPITLGLQQAMVVVQAEWATVLVLLVQQTQVVVAVVLVRTLAHWDFLVQQVVLVLLFFAI